jgi:hypothetical protein
LLITGPDGSGRSSIAKCLIHAYFVASPQGQLTATPTERSAQSGFRQSGILTVEPRLDPEVGNFLTEWLLEIDTEASRKNGNDNPRVVFRGDSLQPRKIVDLLATVGALRTSPDIARMVRDINDSGYAVATLVDQLYYHGHITSLFQLLERAPTLTIFTGTDLGDFGARLKTAFDGCTRNNVVTHSVALETVTGETMKELVELWWPRAAQDAHSKPPIDPGGVADGFENKRESIGRALNILAYVIDDLRDQSHNYDRAQTAAKIERFRHAARRYAGTTRPGP